MMAVVGILVIVAAVVYMAVVLGPEPGDARALTAEALLTTSVLFARYTRRILDGQVLPGFERERGAC